MPLSVEKKKDDSSFSQSSLIGSLSNLQVMRTDIKARTSSNLGCLFVLRLNVPVNNFSVMSGRSHRFLGN